MVLVYLILEKISEFKFLGVPVSLSAILILGYTSILDKSMKPLMPALKSNWITIHVISYFMGYAGLLIAFIVSLIYLSARQRDAAFAKKMDGLSYRMVSFAFPFLTIGLTTGAVWAKNAWGRYWSWDPKETWALITWLIYAALPAPAPDQRLARKKGGDIEHHRFSLRVVYILRGSTI